MEAVRTVRARICSICRLLAAKSLVFFQVGGGGERKKYKKDPSPQFFWMVTDGCGPPQSWDDFANYIDASAEESAAKMRALMLRLQMPPRALATEWSQPHPAPPPQSPTTPSAKKKTTKKGRKKKKRSYERRGTQPCAGCRRRHRRCNSEAGKGACAECTSKDLVCTFSRHG